MCSTRAPVSLRAALAANSTSSARSAGDQVPETPSKESTGDVAPAVLCEQSSALPAMDQSVDAEAIQDGPMATRVPESVKLADEEPVCDSDEDMDVARADLPNKTDALWFVGFSVERQAGGTTDGNANELPSTGES